MQAEAMAAADIEIWPENWEAVNVFLSLATQWTVGMAGAIGLRYESLPVVLRAHGIARSAHSAIFAQLRHLEHAALEAMNVRR